MGLGSIVELCQAQQADAAIGCVKRPVPIQPVLSTLNFEIGVQA